MCKQLPMDTHYLKIIGNTVYTTPSCLILAINLLAHCYAGAEPHKGEGVRHHMYEPDFSGDRQLFSIVLHAAIYSAI